MQQHNIYKTYLITGSPNEREFYTAKLLNLYGLDPKKPSQDIEYLEAPKTKITIGQIRAIKKNAYLKPYKHLRAIILKDAHKLSIIAQNALLKILEEPPLNLLIILEAQNKNQFLQTVLSRVTQIRTEQAVLKSEGLNIENLDLETAFLNLSQIKDPNDWIDNQIAHKYQKLISNLSLNTSSAVKNIEELANTKKLIDANVNTQFALASYVLSNTN